MFDKAVVGRQNIQIMYWWLCGWTVFMMVTVEDLVVEWWSNTASQRNRPPT